MKIVVTGALGHIGSKIVQLLPRHFPEAEVHLIDNLSSGNHDSIEPLPEHYKFYQQDILHCDLESLLENADFAIHLAAQVDPQNYTDHQDINHRMTQKVADACLQTNTCLIFPSTTSVYGVSHPSISEVFEEAVIPQTPYARDKYTSELYLKKLKPKGLRYHIFRFATIFGVSPGMKFETAVGKFCRDALTKSRVQVWSSALKQIRPYLDIKDAVNAIFFAVSSNKLPEGGIHNVATWHACIEDVLSEIRYHMPFDLELTESARMNSLSYKVSCEKIMKQGFVFEGNISQGIRETLAFLSERNANLFAQKSD